MEEQEIEREKREDEEHVFDLLKLGEQTSTNEDEEEVLVPKFKLTRFLNDAPVAGYM
ncbi:hypothetical protein CsSME_00052485 [Camellia sinensis var. sinensis]